jgi:hypothetical protein
MKAWVDIKVEINIFLRIKGIQDKNSVALFLIDRFFITLFAAYVSGVSLKISL